MESAFEEWTFIGKNDATEMHLISSPFSVLDLIQFSRKIFKKCGVKIKLTAPVLFVATIETILREDAHLKPEFRMKHVKVPIAVLLSKNFWSATLNFRKVELWSS